jgi:hypothetical protein
MNEYEKAIALLSKEENAVKMYAQLLSDISDDEYYDS